MRGAVRPRVLAVAAAAAASLVALGGIATAAVWGFRDGPGRSTSTVGGWLALVWVGVAIGVVVVVVVALAGARSLRRPLVDLSRAADQLQNERLPAALRAIEAGGEPAPRAAISAPAELESVAGALENLERFVHYHAKRAQRSDRDLGRLLTGAADRVGIRSRLAEGIDLDPPGALAAALRRDEGALRALVPGSRGAGHNETDDTTETDDTSETDEHAANRPVLAVGPGPSVSDTLAAAALTTLRPPSVGVGELEPAFIDIGAGSAVMVVLGEVIDAALGGEGDVVVWGSVQPEGYHFVVDAVIGDQGAELAHVAEALREREPVHLPFGLRAAVQAGRRARLLVWLTLAGDDAQWHVLVPPDSFIAAPAPAARTITAQPLGQEVAPQPRKRRREAPAPREPVASAAESPNPSPVAETPPDPARLEAAHRLVGALTELFERLEVAIERRPPHGPGLDEQERTALLVDGTRLVGTLQQADLCSSQALRALLRAIDVAVGTDRSVPLTGSARERAVLPYEALAEIRGRIAQAAGAFPTPSR